MISNYMYLLYILKNASMDVGSYGFQLYFMIVNLIM